MRRLLALLGLLVVLGVAALAQGEDAPGEEDNGFLINLIQERLSAPGRRIALQGVTGALSSQARIEEIALSDDEGVWLRLEGVEIDWSRRQLLLGRLEVNRLGVERFAYLRPPVPPELALADRLPEIEAQPFQLPELPVSVQVRELALPRIEIAEAAFGDAAVLSATGSVDLAGGELDAALDVTRIDDPGGSLALDADFSNETRVLDLDLRLQEPEGGVVATLLNIEDRPAIDLRVQGEGPIDALGVEFAFDAGGARIAGGEVQLRGGGEGLGFSADLRGELAPLVPAAYREFFAGETAVEAAGVNLAAGGLRLDRLALRGAALDLTGALATTPDGFPRSLTLTGRLGDPEGPAITLPVPGGETSARSAMLDLEYGEADRWSGNLTLDQLTAGDIEIEDLALTMGGRAENLDDPARRNITIVLGGLATGVNSEDPKTAAALGTRLDLFLDAARAGSGPLAIRQAQVSGNGLSLFAAGTLRDLAFDGRLAARVADISPFSGLAGRDLGGALNLRLNGSVKPLSGAFDLALDGTAQGLQIGDERLDGLLAGETTLSGAVARDAEGIRTDDFRLANPQIEITSNGRLSDEETDLRAEVRLNDLQRIDQQLDGALTATARVTGTGRPLSVSIEAAIPEGRLMDRALTGARLGFEGQADAEGLLRGAIRGEGEFGGQPLVLSAELDIAGEDRALRDLVAEVGPNRLTGAVSRSGEEPISGALELDAPDLAPLAALALTDASGSLDAAIRLDPTESGQGAAVEASIRDLEVGETRVRALDLDAQVTDALRAPLVNGTLAAEGVTAAGLEIDTLSAQAEQADAETMEVSAETRLAVGTEAELTGALSRLPGGFTARLDTLALRQEEASARLTAPATVTVQDGAIRLTPLALDFGTGQLTAQGEIAERFDVDLDIQALPLDLANTIQPALGLEGAVTGSARILGPRAAPDVTFGVTGEDIASAATRAAGLPPVALTAMGRTTEGRLRFEALLGAEGLEAKVSGWIPLGPGALELEAALESFPLSILNNVAPDQDLRGTVSGTATVGGTLAAPTVMFDLRGAGISARPLQENGIASLGVTARGGFVEGAVTLDALEVSNDQGLSVSAAGRAPLRGEGVDIRASGSLPLAAADALLAERTAQAEGVARFDLAAQGALADPQLSGSATLAGGTFVDPQTNIRLQNVSADVGFEGDQVTIRRLRADVAAGGAITATGSVTIDPGSGFPADLATRFEGARYTDGSFISTQLDGELALDGPLVGGGGVLSGTINLGPTEISVAEGLGGNAQVALDEVTHRRPPAAVQATLDRARVDESRAAQEGERGGGGLQTNIRINAPNQIFVRGRGLDVELGGGLTLTGPVNDIVPVGQFDLRRGRLEVLGQRIDFDEGSLQLTGNLDPQIFFVARTRSEDVTAIITVSGRVSSPEIEFSSQPPLPEDEVLARVIFNRDVASLSPFQIAQLAAAAAELAGGGTGGPGILSRLRGAIGFDDLDIITEEDGETAVRAGRYIDENIYLDVQTETGGESRARINLDVTDDLTVRGSVGTDGDSTVGVYFERDY